VSLTKLPTILEDEFPDLYDLYDETAWAGDNIKTSLLDLKIEGLDFRGVAPVYAFLRSDHEEVRISGGEPAGQFSDAPSQDSNARADAITSESGTDEA
jgi:hypothetical protein